MKGSELRGGFREVSRMAIGWEDIIIQAMFAMCAREHIFWFGQPGRAKSWVVRLIFSLFPDARTFSTQIRKDTMPANLFGNEIPKEYMESGREIYNLTGGICDAQLAYLDEFFDGPDFLIRAMNTVLNERVFETKDQGRIVVPLHTAIMTTNFDRYGLALEAARDRMLCKAVVPTVGGLVDRVRMYDSYLAYAGAMPPLPKMSFADLKQLADTVESPNGVQVPDEIRLLHSFLILRFLEKRMEREKAKLQAGDPNKVIRDEDVKLEPVTPRTETKLHDFSRVSAILNDRLTVEASDLRAIRYGLVTVNSGTGDEETWEDVCNTYIPRSQAQIGRLKKLAVIARKVAELKQLGQGFTNVVLKLAGETETYTKVTILQLIDKIANRDGVLIVEMGEVLKKEIGSLDNKSTITPFPWEGEW